MKLDWHYFETPTGQLVLIGLLAVMAAGAFAWQRVHSRTATMPAPPEMATPSLPRVFQRAAAKFEPPAPALAPAPVASAPAAPKPVAPKILPLAVSRRLETDGTTAAAPYGRMIPCETVVTLESNRLTTPVIGLVTADVWENGQLMVPAGAEVHGRASLDRSRERISVDGMWVIVAKEGPSRKERQVSGIALTRDGTGSSDGSAGLRGLILRTDDSRELKLFAAAFLSSATAALQENRSVAGPMGESALAAVSARNAALAGTGAVIREYAEQLREAIARDGFFVRVPAGTPFYLYVAEALPSAAAVPAKQP